MIRALLLALAVATALAPRPSQGAETSAARHRVGDVFEITRVRDSASKGDGSSGSTHDRDLIVERVIEVRPGGLVLEYDLPAAATARDRASNWQFPVRVFVPNRGALQLLNGPELEARVDPWLRAAEMSRANCGRWIFTWNAFRIECDPNSVIGVIEGFRFVPGQLRAGDLYQDDEALAPGRVSAGPASATFRVSLVIDPDRVRRRRAESDVVVTEIMRKPTTLDAALRERAKEDISGSISVTFSTDAAGDIRRRIKVVELAIKTPDGKTERETVTETIEKRRVFGR